MATEPEKIEYGGDMMLFISTLPVAFSTAAKLEIKLATRETSSKDSGYWKEKLAGRMDWSCSSDALYTGVLTGTATTTSFDELYTLMIARTALTVVFGRATGAAGAQTVDSTKKKFTGSAFITSLSVNAPDGDNTSYSISLEGSGSLVMA
jgi:predicted secreted protein